MPRFSPPDAVSYFQERHLISKKDSPQIATIFFQSPKVLTIKFTMYAIPHCYSWTFIQLFTLLFLAFTTIHWISSKWECHPEGMFILYFPHSCRYLVFYPDLIKWIVVSHAIKRQIYCNCVQLKILNYTGFLKF